ncbi:hypothetical protein DACRYDRAFT_16262 [Dacryopinax primogenitus]|uniref:Uncharacterized protein n=1 Tax=Dacryopinax primogenitus (strain DJM 731) TaxID=1858805 RepID=M5FV45_DACPD|nr:uncharacterized protein DACRYDRAFT_16262 [Dacryopinax primogenitus]EJU01641.1 hypothetical protein DACRYDRAFT_16262 [Dacryopinax primogenitus]
MPPHGCPHSCASGRACGHGAAPPVEDDPGLAIPDDREDCFDEDDGLGEDDDWNSPENITLKSWDRLEQSDELKMHLLKTMVCVILPVGDEEDFLSEHPMAQSAGNTKSTLNNLAAAFHTIRMRHHKFPIVLQTSRNNIINWNDIACNVLASNSEIFYMYMFWQMKYFHIHSTYCFGEHATTIEYDAIMDWCFMKICSDILLQWFDKFKAWADNPQHNVNEAYLIPYSVMLIKALNEIYNPVNPVETALVLPYDHYMYGKLWVAKVQMFFDEYPTAIILTPHIVLTIVAWWVLPHYKHVLKGTGMQAEGGQPPTFAMLLANMHITWDKNQDLHDEYICYASMWFRDPSWIGPPAGQALCIEPVIVKVLEAQATSQACFPTLMTSLDWYELHKAFMTYQLPIDEGTAAALQKFFMHEKHPFPDLPPGEERRLIVPADFQDTWEQIHKH